MIRIISGIWRGHKLPVPRGRDIRPTSDRVKTAVFNILGATCRDARVLDLYAGAGSIGFEALSRGARHVTCIEKNPAYTSALRHTARTLGCEDKIVVLTADIHTAPHICATGPYDIIYADPPYATTDIPALLALCATPTLSHTDTLLIIECAARDTSAAQTSAWKHYDTRHYGATRLYFYARDTHAHTVGD